MEVRFIDHDKNLQCKKFLFLGQAEAIASEILEAAVFQNFNVKLHCLKDEGKEFHIQDVKCAVFVCSTTGIPYSLLFFITSSCGTKKLLVLV